MFYVFNALREIKWNVTYLLVASKMETFSLWQQYDPNYDLFWYDILAIINYFLINFVNLNATISC